MPSIPQNLREKYLKAESVRHEDIIREQELSRKATVADLEKKLQDALRKYKGV